MSTRASAARYARALFDVVLNEGNPEQVEQELTQVAELVTGTPDLRRALESPAVPATAKRAVLQALLPKLGVSRPVEKLLLLLAERDRLTLVPDLAAAYSAKLMEHRQVVRAEVTTAAPLSADQAARIERRLAEATGGRVTMSTRVDPSIIGGAVARVGSIVYDGSVATQLQRIRERLAQTR